jgi:hypothetical protein
MNENSEKEKINLIIDFSGRYFIIYINNLIFIEI